VGFVASGFAIRPRLAERVRSELGRRFAAMGFHARVPAYEAALAFGPSILPVDSPRPRGYWHTLHTDGAAAFFPFIDEAVAEPDGILVGLLLEDAAPVLLNRWAHSSHSWGIFGTTGAGKSFAAGLLALRSRWRYPGLEVIVIDPLGEFVPWARELGGSVLSLGPETGQRLNPLDPVTTAGDRLEKAGRVGTLLRALFPSLHDEEVAVLDSALHRLYSSGPEVPTFTDLLEQLGGTAAGTGRLATLLEVFRSGSLSHLNGPSTCRWEGNPLVITLAGVPEDHLPFHLSYILDAVYGRLRQGDRRRLLLVDEAHFLVRHATTAEFFDGMVRHIRHFGAGLLLMSQHPEDFLRTAPGRSLLRNLRASLLLRLTHVSPEVREFFQLTGAEAEWLPHARLPREAGYSEGLLRLGSAHLPIAVVASTPEYEFLSRAGAAGSPTSSPSFGAGPNAPLSDREGRRTLDERRGERPRGPPVLTT
jgi:conjugal transfer ATP-binding protein TraC